MKKLIIVLPRGESIKNFVYSGITDTLREKYQIIFFSVIPNQELKDYLLTKCDHLEELEQISISSKYVQFVNSVLQIAHLNKLNSTTGNFKNLKEDLYSSTKLSSKIIRKCRKTIASLFRSQNSLKKLTDYYIRLNFNKKEVVFFEHKLKELNASLLFNTSHIHNKESLDLMYAAKKNKIKTATFLFSWDNLTSQGRILPDYDYYFTWNKKIKKDLLNYYPAIKQDTVFITGTPQFDFHFDKEFLNSKESLYEFLGIDSSKKIILYSTGMAYYTPKEYLIVKEIEKTIQKIDKNLVLVVRIYAKDDNTEYYKMRSNTNIRVPDHFWEIKYKTPTIKDIKLFNSLINHCEIGINVASTVSLDLAVINKPIINVAFNPPGVSIYPNDYAKIYEFDHYKPIIESGAIALATSIEELEKQIRAYLEDNTHHELERKKLVQDFFGEELYKDKKEVFTKIFSQIM